ncbi:TPA: hypothetical protein DEP58_02810 [Patescibacteria group bacterium]|nr:MAG: hypothetical protein UU98_C0027G0011 [Parcubacteria group bacterium GW2011_GWD2_42_14]HCC05214.1 hypothetical protein [Patescibacteria group bacterium]
MTQGEKADKEECLSKSLQEGSGVEEDVQRYTFPLTPERKRKIAEAYQRRIGSGLPNDPQKIDGW